MTDQTITPRSIMETRLTAGAPTDPDSLPRYHPGEAPTIELRDLARLGTAPRSGSRLWYALPDGRELRIDHPLPPQALGDQYRVEQVIVHDTGRTPESIEQDERGRRLPVPAGEVHHWWRGTLYPAGTFADGGRP